MNWILKRFSELSPDELYAILQLRNEVFVIEQNCLFQDADNKDQLSCHLMGWSDGILAAYSRLVPPGIAFDKASIGRVVISPARRGTGAGKELMRISIENIKHLYGNNPIMIGAQLYLKKFYESIGFSQVSSIYLEDGIEHIQMMLS
ncbi:MAG: GNAT family N-acetyltransferase [Chitinophagaceae bacterium]|jgi:ElaA protein|nr:GNAT family N-acetyltransferase [Chitinophagaceae bacterium]OQY92811.1 MAG: GNAT family N-acetyltransferase [Sphingobacteriales bacterium UTBCD1]